MKGRTDALIVGGGVIGLACAYELLARGRSVRILDRGLLGHGTSLSNCGLITPSHGAPLAQPGMIAQALRSMFQKDAPLRFAPRLSWSFLRWGLRFAARCNARDMRRAMAAKVDLLTLSMRLLHELIARDGVECDWETAGLLMVYRSEAGLASGDELDRVLADFGLAPRKLGRNDLLEMEPALRGDVAGARYHAADAHLKPEKLVAELARLVRAQGAIVEEHCASTGFRVENGRVTSVATERGPREADDVVLAAGPWSPALGRLLGITIPIEPGKGYTITTAPPAAPPRIPLILEERRIAVTPWRDGFRLGSTMEFAGYDSTLNRVRLDAIVNGAGEYLRTPIGDGERREWFGWRPMTPDDLPLIGRAPRLSNLVLATGHNMLGTSMALGTARIVADLVAGVAPPVDIRPFAPERP